MRKTANVKELLDYANRQLSREDEHATKDFKSGIATMIETVLFNSNQYNGYMHLGGNKVEDADYYDRFYHMKKED